MAVLDRDAAVPRREPRPLLMPPSRPSKRPLGDRVGAALLDL